MADKITVKTQKIFSDSGTFANAIAKFGTYKSGTPLYSTDPDVIQGFTGATGHTGLTGQNAWSEGWNAAVDANLCPTIEDMNAFFYVVSRQIKNNLESGIPLWLATKTYYIGSYVKSSTGRIFISLADDNINNALTDTSKWMSYYPNKARYVTDNHNVTYDDMIIIWNALTTESHRFINFPTASAIYKGRRIFICAADLTVESLVVVDIDASNPYHKYDAGWYECDGSSWRAVERYTFS